jgi:hypothetical protein
MERVYWIVSVPILLTASNTVPFTTTKKKCRGKPPGGKFKPAGILTVPDASPEGPRTPKSPAGVNEKI